MTEKVLVFALFLDDSGIFPGKKYNLREGFGPPGKEITIAVSEHREPPLCFLVTPGGTLQRYNVDTGEIDVICIDMPRDPAMP